VFKPLLSIINDVGFFFREMKIVRL